MNQLSIFDDVWIDVVGYEGLYQVNGKGEVKSLNYRNTGKKKIMRTWKNNNGYLYVDLCKNYKYERFLVHRLVYEAFYGKIPDGMEIDHIDTNRQNNRVENLRCVTHKENRNNQITKVKSRENTRKIFGKPVIQYTKDKQFVKRWECQIDIERELGYSQQNISACCHGKYKQAYGFIWEHEEDQAD